MVGGAPLLATFYAALPSYPMLGLAKIWKRLANLAKVTHAYKENGQKLSVGLSLCCAAQVPYARRIQHDRGGSCSDN